MDFQGIVLSGRPCNLGDAMTDQGSPQSPYGPSPHPGCPTPPANPYAQGRPNPYTPQNPYAPQNPGDPLTPAPPRGTQIQEYAAPRVPLGVIIGVVAGLLLVAVMFASFFLARPEAPPTATAKPTASAAASEQGMPFVMPQDADATGVWQIIGREWTPDGVSVHVRIAAKTGRITYGFLAFSNSGTMSVYPTTGGRSPELRTGALNEGEVADGYVFLGLDRGTATLFLTTSMGRQVSALPISA